MFIVARRWNGFRGRCHHFCNERFITANCYDDLIKLLITSQPILWSCWHWKHHELLTNRQTSLLKQNRIRERAKYLLALCHIVASRQSIIVEVFQTVQAATLRWEALIWCGLLFVCVCIRWYILCALCFERDAIISCSRQTNKKSKRFQGKHETGNIIR